MQAKISIQRSEFGDEDCCICAVRYVLQCGAISLNSVLEGGSIWAPKTERWAVDVVLLPEGRLVEGPLTANQPYCQVLIPKGIKLFTNSLY
jgi:hypothetical protein